MAAKDDKDNMGAFLMDDTMSLYIGGKPKGAAAYSWSKMADSKSIGDINSIAPHTTLVGTVEQLVTEVVSIQHSIGTHVVKLSAGTIEVDDAYSGSFMTILMDTFSGGATDNIYDGKPHTISFKWGAGKPAQGWASNPSSSIWYLKASNSELGNLMGASGKITQQTLEAWIGSGALITIVYDGSAKEFAVTGIAVANPVTVPDVLKADGSVQLESTYKPTAPYDIASVKSVTKLIREFRTTVVFDTAGTTKVTRAEAITTFKLLPHFDWALDDAYYIKDSNGKK